MAMGDNLDVTAARAETEQVMREELRKLYDRAPDEASRQRAVQIVAAVLGLTPAHVLAFIKGGN